MASRVAAMALAGARPTAHAPGSAANTRSPEWRTQPILNRRGLIARASHRPSCAAEVGAPALDFSDSFQASSALSVLLVWRHGCRRGLSSGIATRSASHPPLRCRSLVN
ncbi:hypothetical protein PVAP13_2NG536103 [Panicum virgatum]|uniref:Uncharacterized protein n=1 Tax=Panicum virgatum TaxID=38727 RepID=A0A8T0VRZ6_PANVG|nr:hypothetical protein PVAP13_2NG536103 [Panicum virgatum]